MRWFLVLGFLALVLKPLDEAFVRWVNPDAPHALDGFAVWLDHWSTRSLLIGLALALFGAFMLRPFARMRFATAHFLVGWLSTDLVVQVLKRVVGRPRPVHPEGIVEVLRPIFDNPDTKSFPSGHTATAVAIAVLICIHVKSRVIRGFFVAFAAAIALGRCYIGAHYLSDILAGAAIGWAAMSVTWHGVAMIRPQIESVTAPRRLWPLTLVGFVVIMSWLLKSPAVLTDFATGEAAEGYRVTTPALRLLLEPFVGLGLEVARVADLLPWLRAALVWFAVATILLFRFFRFRGLVAAGIIALWGAVNAWVAVSGVGLASGLAVRGDEPRVVFDLQSHGGDAIDGKVDLEGSLERFAGLGLDLVVPTHHNRWAQGRELVDGEWVPVDLWGMEWSPGDHRRTPLHVLVYNTSPEPADLAGRDLATLIRDVHAAGGLVVMSHFWRGDENRLPSLEELVVLGVDGFEVAGRNQEVAPDILARQAAIQRVVAREGMIGLANSDYHGSRSAHYQWNTVAKKEGETGAAAVWRALKSPRDVDILTLESSSIPGFLATPAHPPFTLIGYFRGMPTGGRGVWILLLVAAGWLWGRWRKPGA